MLNSKDERIRRIRRGSTETQDPFPRKDHQVSPTWRTSREAMEESLINPCIVPYTTLPESSSFFFRGPCWARLNQVSVDSNTIYSNSQVYDQSKSTQFPGSSGYKLFARRLLEVS